RSPSAAWRRGWPSSARTRWPRCSWRSRRCIACWHRKKVVGTMATKTVQQDRSLHAWSNAAQTSAGERAGEPPVRVRPRPSASNDQSAEQIGRDVYKNGTSLRAASRAFAGDVGSGLLGRLTRGFNALEVRNYRLYWVGQLISQTGSWMQTTAQAWLVLQLTRSPFALGLVTTLQFLPIMLLSLIGGVITDRLPKHRLIVTTQALALLPAP